MSLLKGYEYLFADLREPLDTVQIPIKRDPNANAIEQARINLENEKRELQRLKKQLKEAENPQGDDPFDRDKILNAKKNPALIARIKAVIKTKTRSVERYAKAHSSLVAKSKSTSRDNRSRHQQQRGGDNRSARQKRMDNKNPFAGASGSKGGRGQKGPYGSSETSTNQKGEVTQSHASTWTDDEGNVHRYPSRGEKGGYGHQGTAGLPGKAIPLIQPKGQLGKQPGVVGKIDPGGNLSYDLLKKRTQQLKDEDEERSKRTPTRNPKLLVPRGTPKIAPVSDKPWYDRDRPNQYAGYNTKGHKNYDPEWHKKFPAIYTPTGWRVPTAEEINKAKGAAKAYKEARKAAYDLEQRRNRLQQLIDDGKVASDGDREALIQTQIEQINKDGSAQWTIMNDALSDIRKISNGRGYQVSSKKYGDKRKGTSGPKGPKGILGIDGTTNQNIARDGGTTYDPHHPVV